MVPMQTRKKNKDIARPIRKVHGTNHIQLLNRTKQPKLRLPTPQVAVRTFISSDVENADDDDDQKKMPAVYKQQNKDDSKNRYSSYINLLDSDVETSDSESFQKNTEYSNRLIVRKTKKRWTSTMETLLIDTPAFGGNDECIIDLTTGSATGAMHSNTPLHSPVAVHLEANNVAIAGTPNDEVDINEEDCESSTVMMDNVVDMTCDDCFVVNVKKRKQKNTENIIISNNYIKSYQCEQDQAIAAALQSLEDENMLLECGERSKKRSNQEILAMTSSTCGKAVILVNRLVERILKFSAEVLPLSGESTGTTKTTPNAAVAPSVAPVGYLNQISYQLEPFLIDDMVHFAEQFIEMYHAWKISGYSASELTVNIGYHYTKSLFLDSIKTVGLLSHAERKEKNVNPNTHNGSSYGEGIYTANDPLSTSSYGDVGLMVARLIGKKGSFTISPTSPDIDTIEANNCVVLRKSSQCLPIVRFSTAIIGTILGSNKDEDCSSDSSSIRYITELQGILQTILNDIFHSTSDDDKNLSRG